MLTPDYMYTDIYTFPPEYSDTTEGSCGLPLGPGFQRLVSCFVQYVVYSVQYICVNVARSNACSLTVQ